MRGGWYPVGLVTAPSSQLVNKAIFTNEDALLQARHKASPERPSANQGGAREILFQSVRRRLTLLSVQAFQLSSLLPRFVVGLLVAFVPTDEMSAILAGGVECAFQAD